MVSLLYCMPTSLYFPGGAGLGACAGAQKLEQLFRDEGFMNITRTVNALGLCLTGDKTLLDCVLFRTYTY